MVGDSFMMMALGEYRFGLPTAAYQDLSRTNSWRWPTVDRIGARPASQFVGPGEESISMSGLIYPHFRGGLGQLDAMRAEADKGEPLILVDGSGKNWGKFVITDIREGQSIFWSNGAPRRQEFDITLQAYGGEDAEAIPAAGAVSIPALSVPSMDSVIGDFIGGDPLAFAQTVASKSMMSMPNVRSVVGMTTAGVGALTDAISVTGSVFGSVSGVVDGMKRAAAAVPRALNSLLSTPSLSTFAAFGTDLDLLVRTATGTGAVPLDSVLDAVNTIGLDKIAPRLFADADQLAAFKALAEVRANG